MRSPALHAFGFEGPLVSLWLCRQRFESLLPIWLLQKCCYPRPHPTDPPYRYLEGCHYYHTCLLDVQTTDFAPLAAASNLLYYSCGWRGASTTFETCKCAFCRSASSTSAVCRSALLDLLLQMWSHYTRYSRCAAVRDAFLQLPM